MTTSDLIAVASLGAAIASLAVSVVALFVAIYAIRKANQTSSAATLVSLNEGFRQAWDRYFAATTDSKKDFEVAELLNLLEIACGIFIEQSLTGNSKVLMEDYLSKVLSLVTGDAEINEKALKLLQDSDTFIFIKTFIKQRQLFPRVTIPVDWYKLC